MAKSLQVTVTNPDDLNTLQGELVTQNYNLEILGLKNPADFRKFSKSLMMLDRILKETNDKVDNGLKTKLDKGSYEGDAQSLKDEIDGKEPAFSKNSGFNKEKTSEYKSGKDAEKLFTQAGANNLYKEVEENIRNIRNIDLIGKVSKTGDYMTGDLSFEKYKGIQLEAIWQANGNGGVKNSSNWITSGEDYAGTDKLNNVAIQTWNGFSVSSTYSSNVGEVIFNVDARNKSAYVRKDFRVDGHIHTTGINTNDPRLITRNKNITNALNKDLYKRIGNYATNDVIDYIKIKLSTKYNSPNMQSFKIIGRGLFNTLYTLISEINIGWYYCDGAIWRPKAIISTGADRLTDSINEEIKIFLANDGGNVAIIIRGSYHSSVDIFRNSDEGICVEPNPIALEIVPISEDQKNQMSGLVELKPVISYNSETLKINKEWETIYTGNIGNGTFTTSKSIWDYKYIQIIGTNDDEEKLWIEEHEISNIRYCLENWESKWFLISNGDNFWTVQPSILLADGRTFKTYLENCRIYQIRVSK